MAVIASVIPGSSKRKLAKPELLAPAGSLEKLKVAIHYGADAVYLGGKKYGLRSSADNFSFEEMREGVAFANQYGARVFAAVNIYAHHEDLSGFAEYVAQLHEIGISAIITADPGLIHIVQTQVPQMEIHLSTQQSTMNYQTVQFWKDMGLPRVVLARETSFDDIRTIKDKVDIEIEAFIHGAMCSSYSGRCVLSNHFTDRDSNRGGCSQSCRWKYELMLNGQRLPGFQWGNDHDHFTMGSKDMGMIAHIPALIESGIDSFKIEGRMKSIHYVGSVVHAYRQAIDSYMDDPDNYVLKPEWVAEINKAANRPLGTGFYLDAPGAADHIYEPENKKELYDFSGMVLDYDPNEQVAYIQQRNYFEPGQEVEFFGPTGARFQQTIDQIRDEEGNALQAARHPLQVLKVHTVQPVEKWDMLRKKN